MNNKDTLVLEIGENIKKHRILEVKNDSKNVAVAFANVNYFGSDQKIWLTNNPNNGGFRKNTNIQGYFTGTSEGKQTTITSDGYAVYKNTRIGEVIIKYSKGKHKIATPKGVKIIEIHNKSSFIPNPHIADAIDLQMNIGEKKPRFYRKLSELLSHVQHINQDLEKLNQEKEELEKKTQSKKESAKINELISRIESEEKERKNTLDKAQTFIRKNAELRYQPILDPWQEEIKRSHIFDATIAIDGGPGTGKTTSLIQRIKFLIDEDAMADYLPNLTREKKEKLFNQKTSWVFFSPNELLKLFLRNNMILEGLQADDSRVLVWEDYKGVLIRKYKLVNPETQNPFLILRRYKNKDLLPHDSESLKNILQAFDAFYLKFQNKRLENLAEIDVTPFIWKDKALSIQNYIKRHDKDYTFEGLIRLYFNLYDNFSEEVKAISQEFNGLLKKSSAGLLNSLKDNKVIIEKLFDLLEKWKKESKNDDEDLDEEDLEIEEILDDSTSLQLQLFNKLKSLVKKNALRVYDKSVKLNKKDKELIEIISTVIELETVNDYDKIGQLAYFAKYYERSVKGIVSNLISEIPTLYKKFRKDEYLNKKNKWNYKVLEHILLKEEAKNKRIHPNEQAFLLNFINNIVKKSFKVSKIKTKKINHQYFNAYNEVCRPVIGVDEATDFHLIDLLAIHSLSDHEISSVTYSGDIMQRLTEGGIRNWNDLNPFIKNFNEKKLLISYRQSPTLLDVATTIYNKATNSKAEYMSFMDKDKNEPQPLFFIEEDEEERVEWISERILEIYKAYGNSIPSIAIFLSQEDKIFKFANKLGEIDKLADVGIKVKASNNGQVLGDTNTVRVFSIEHIKGLEFEAVFYHNINEVFNASNKEMVLKNLYVGLSRASFYLGITSSEETEDLAFLNDIFHTENINWKIQ